MFQGNISKTFFEKKNWQSPKSWAQDQTFQSKITLDVAVLKAYQIKQDFLQLEVFFLKYLLQK